MVNTLDDVGFFKERKHRSQTEAHSFEGQITILKLYTSVYTELLSYGMLDARCLFKRALYKSRHLLSKNKI